jgi:hypothetical protein
MIYEAIIYEYCLRHIYTIIKTSVKFLFDIFCYISYHLLSFIEIQINLLSQNSKSMEFRAIVHQIRTIMTLRIL